MKNAIRCTLASLIWFSLGCSPVTASSVAHKKAVSTTRSSFIPHGPRMDGFLSVRPPRHIVVVIEENHSYSEIVGNKDAPFLNRLMHSGALLANYHGVEHPSQPNYLDLFSGSNQGITDDTCPHWFAAPNLASELTLRHQTFIGYAESMPYIGYKGCTYGRGWAFGAAYARKHNPWVNFTNLPKDVNVPFASFPKNYAKLPTIAFVVPNLQHDMHSASVAAGDGWLKREIGPYAAWTRRHDSLLIVIWDEDDESQANQVPAVFVGPMIRQGVYHQNLNHFNVLRTLEDLYRLRALGKSRIAAPITNIWK